MATISLNLNLHSSNAAFSDDPHGELQRILRDSADMIDPGLDSLSRPIRDVNGNKIGHLNFEVDIPPADETAD